MVFKNFFEKSDRKKIAPEQDNFHHTSTTSRRFFFRRFLFIATTSPRLDSSQKRTQFCASGMSENSERIFSLAFSQSRPWSNVILYMPVNFLRVSRPMLFLFNPTMLSPAMRNG